MSARIGGLLIASAMALPVSEVVAADAAAKAPAGATTTKGLMKERRDVLQSVVQWRERQYASGSVDLPLLIRAKLALGDAELDLAGSKAERLAVRQQQLDSLRELEHALKMRFDTGRVTETDLLESKAERLKAEIDLLREKGEQAAR